jgi:hypothetical protein
LHQILEDFERLSAGLAPAELMVQFESLGNNCEFGAVQRRWGAEPLGLFRFAGVLNADKLSKAIESYFDGMFNAEYLRFGHDNEPNGSPEMYAYQLKFDFWLHVTEKEAELETERRLAVFTRRLAFLTRKLVDDLMSAQKIFVVKCELPNFEANAHKLYQALQTHGPNTLLWVDLAKEDEVPGAVECLGERLFKGYVDYFGGKVPRPDSISPDVWLEVCRNAYDLRAHLYGSRAPEWQG